MSGTSGSRDPRYNCKRWRDLSKTIIKRDPDCKGLCDGANRSWIADHIVPVKDGGDFWAESNLRGLCAPCHRFLSRQQQGERGELPGRRAERIKRLVRGCDPTTGIPLGGWW